MSDKSMKLEQAMFILRHGSAEGEHKYFEAISVIEKAYNRLKAENKNCGVKIQFQREQLRACNEKIKEQQAEIERLKRLLAEEEAKYSVCAKQFYKEGAKDFSERLKALLPNDGMSPEGRFKFGRIKSLDIDNLLQEMG